jgi:hypothetical protein
MDNTIVYSVRCTRIDTKKVVLSDDIMAMPWIDIEGFSKYWLESFGKEVERLSEDNSCEVTINCSTGESRKFTRVVNVEKSFKDITASESKPVVEDAQPVQVQSQTQTDDSSKDEKVEEQKIEKPKRSATKKSDSVESKKESKPKSKSKKSDAKPAEDK